MPGPRGDVVQGELAAQVVLDPAQQRFERGARGVGRLVVHDELRLPALPFQRHHRQPGGVGGDRGAVVAADQVQAQVQAGGGARRGEDLAVVDVEDVRDRP